MKKGIIIGALVLLLLIGGRIWYYNSRLPKTDFENIDYIGKSVKYRISIDGFSWEGTHNEKDFIQEKDFGKYTFHVGTSHDNGFTGIHLIIYDTATGDVIKGSIVDMTNKKVFPEVAKHIVRTSMDNAIKAESGRPAATSGRG